MTTPNTPRRPDALAADDTPPAEHRRTGCDETDRASAAWQDIARRLCRIGRFDAGRVAGVLCSLETGLYITDAVALADGVLAAQTASRRH